MQALRTVMGQRAGAQPTSSAAWPVRYPHTRAREEAAGRRFGLLAFKDLQQTLYSSDERALRSDLRFLKEQQGLVSHDLVNARRDGRSRPIERIEVVTLTPAGEKLARVSSSFSPDQKLYHGVPPSISILSDSFRWPR
jgi:hypothetical protein